MSLHRLPSEFRRRLLANPSTHQRRHASILFALSALSNSRETQHFNKATKLSRVEHSPALKLIQTSEVDPFASTEKRRLDVSGAAGVTGKRDSSGGAQSIGTGIAGGANATVASTGSAAHAAASGSESGGSARQPSADEQDEVKSGASEGSLIDDEVALEIGRGFLNKHVQRAQMLQRAQKTDRRRIRELENEVEDLKKKVEEQRREEEHTIQALKNERSASSMFTLVLGVGGGLVLWYVLGDARPGAEQTKKLQNQLEERQAELSSARAKLEKELSDVRRAHGQALATAGNREREAHVKDQNYEPRRAQRTRQAEELKAAVEGKDASSLTRAEREAYAEALVWLRMMDAPERRWWRGLFWCQE